MGAANTAAFSTNPALPRYVTGVLNPPPEFVTLARARTRSGVSIATGRDPFGRESFLSLRACAARREWDLRRTARMGPAPHGANGTCAARREWDPRRTALTSRAPPGEGPAREAEQRRDTPAC